MDIKYWVWLQLCLGAGARFKPIIEEFGSPGELYSNNVIDWKMSPVLSPFQTDKLSGCSLRDAEQVIMDCDINGWDIICYEDERYPQKLREISNPPAVLYVDGKLPELDKYATVGVVGTRKASGYGMTAARLMSKGIAHCGGIIISGAALGIDSAAHKGALEADAVTVAVLGSGFGTGYLRANSGLRQAIKEKGALITEFPPYIKANRTTFPMRNRIISGLSDGLLVVEAGVKSGSLITAQHAAEQGRDVFVIPASILDYNFYGTNKLIDDGAAVATSPEIILERYESAYRTLDMSKLKTIRELAEDGVQEERLNQLSFENIRMQRAERLHREEKALQLEGNELKVYNALEEKLQPIDLIIEKSGLEAPKVLAALTVLEMKGIIESASGKQYMIK
ncbi:MAG: DNA-processing protein DprA [Eubacterium sp.]|nr:DNA-processing protein DprA [Eubacterium sp.]